MTSFLTKNKVASSSILLGMLLLGIAVLPSTIHAQATANGQPVTNAGTSVGPLTNATAGAQAQAATLPDTSGQTPAATAASVANTVATAAVPGLGAVEQGLSAVLSGFGGAILNGVAYFVFELAATLLGFVGLIFNWVVTVSVFDFALYFANSPGFLTAWGILRDVGNILLLFGFIFMGISTILDIQNFSAKRTLPGLLIFAVLLNFSLFASEAVVDVANTLTSSLYTQAGTSSSTATCSSNTSQNSCTNVGIAGQVLVASGISTMWNTGSGTQASKSTSALVLFLLAIFAFITAAVLLSGAIMLFVRAIVLVFLLIASPLGFAGMALPPFHGMAMSWWNKLLSEAFFAPVFLLLIFVSIAIVRSFPGTQTQSFGQAVSIPGSSNVGIFFVFILMMGFMVASLMAARKMGASGADHAISFSQKVVGFAPAVAGRAIVGGGSAGVARVYDRGVGRLIGSDNRFVRGLGRSINATAGEGVMALTGAGRSAKFGLSRSYDEDQKHRKERGDHAVHEAETAAHTRATNAGIAAYKAAPAGAAGDAARDAGKAKAQDALQKLGTAEVEKLLKATRDPKDKQLLAQWVSAAKAKEIMNSKEFGPGDKEKFMHDRFKEQTEKLGKVAEALQALNASGKTPADRAAFRAVFDDNQVKLTNSDAELIAKNYPELMTGLLKAHDDPALGGNGQSIVSAKLLDFLKDNESLNDVQRGAARARTMPGQLDAAAKANDQIAIENLMTNMGKNIGDAAVSTILNAHVIDNTNGQMWSAIMAKNEINDKQKRLDFVNAIKIKGTGSTQYQDFKAYLKKAQNSNWWGARDINDAAQWP